MLGMLHLHNIVLSSCQVCDYLLSTMHFYSAYNYIEREGYEGWWLSSGSSSFVSYRVLVAQTRGSEFNSWLFTVCTYFTSSQSYSLVHLFGQD